MFVIAFLNLRTTKKGNPMGYYKILLADDEIEIRDGMIQKIDWNALGFEIVAAAENGIEALELLEQTAPDVIMTDIKMPFMDGLEFIEKAVEILPAVKIIVFSGFDDFEYAQKAIKLSVEEYMLKPISSQQLSETLRNLKEKMDAEFLNKQDMDSLKRSYEESFPILREQFLVGLIEGYIPKAQICAKAEQYQLNRRANCRTVVLVAVDHEPIVEEAQFQNTFKGREELILIALKQTADRVLSRFHTISSFQYAEHIVAIVELEWESQISMLINEVNEVCKEGRQIIGLDVAAGIGGLYRELGDIRYAYKEAENALEYSTLFCRDGEHTTYIKDVEPDDSIKIQFTEMDERLLTNAIKAGDQKRIEEQINLFFAELEKSRLPFHLYQIHILEIFTVVLKITNLYQLDTKEIFGEELNYISTVLGLHSLNQIHKWFTNNCIKISEQIQVGRMDSGKTLTNKAKQFVEENYSDSSLSVETLCAELHVSPAYFSTIFKKEAKTSFISYLTDIRLQEAVKLLDTTMDKTYIIASKVGYMEPNYFSYVFKKKYGISPSKYRNRQAEEVEI